MNLADESGNIRSKFKTAKRDAKKLGHVTNGPWEDDKGKAYEGGHRVPFIARWPGKIKANSESDCLLTPTDLFATAANMVDRELPDDSASDSFSLLPILLGRNDQIAEREAIFILGNGKDSAISVCTGRWKLVYRYGDDAGMGHELYDLQNDRGEQNNLVKENPEEAQSLIAALKSAESSGATRKIR